MLPFKIVLNWAFFHAKLAKKARLLAKKRRFFGFLFVLSIERRLVKQLILFNLA